MPKTGGKKGQCQVSPAPSRKLCRQMGEREGGFGKTAEEEDIGKERATIHRNSSQKERIHCKCENTEKYF